MVYVSQSPLSEVNLRSPSASMVPSTVVAASPSESIVFGRDITVDRVGGDRRGHVLVGLEFLFVDFDVEAEFAHVERGLGVVLLLFVMLYSSPTKFSVLST